MGKSLEQGLMTQEHLPVVKQSMSGGRTQSFMGGTEPQGWQSTLELQCLTFKLVKAARVMRYM